MVPNDSRPTDGRTDCAGDGRRPPNNSEPDGDDPDGTLRPDFDPIQIERSVDGVFRELYVLRDPDSDDHLVFVLTADGEIHHVATFDPVALNDG